jgi:hypothetical protein
VLSDKYFKYSKLYISGVDDFKSNLKFQVELEFLNWARNFNLNMKFTIQYVGNFVIYRECCKFQIYCNRVNKQEVPESHGIRLLVVGQAPGRSIKN